jgi:hypothetical protein
MSHSLLSADRNTHIKIAVVALIAGMVVVAVGINARTTDPDLTASRTGTDAPVLKAGAPATYSSADSPARH